MNANTRAFSYATFALTLAIALAGGATFAVLGMPGPWLSGPAIAVAIASLFGLDLGVPKLVRNAALVFLGATMGTAVTPDSLALMSRWPLSLAGLAAVVMAIMLSISFYLERVHRYDRATARLAGVPGALPYVLALAADSTGDVRRITIIQMMRLAILLICLPSVLTLIGAGSAGGAPPAPPQAPIVVWQLAALLAAATLGGLLFERLGAPAGMLFGAMVTGALLYGTGSISSGRPDWLMLPGFVVIGAMVGANFAGTDLALFRATALAGIGSVAVGGAVALAFAWPVAALLGVPVAQVWLAYAPGGVETMTIMALALNLDPAYVGAHHVARFLGLGLVVPWWLRAHLRRANHRQHEGTP